MMAGGVLRLPAASGLQDHILGRTELDAGGWTQRWVSDSARSGWDSRLIRVGWSLLTGPRTLMQNYAGFCGVEVEMEEEMAHRLSTVWIRRWRW